MATHSSILAWRIPWTEQPGGLQSMGRKESDSTERLHFHFLSFQLNTIGRPAGGALLPCDGSRVPQEENTPLSWQGLGQWNSIVWVAWIIEIDRNSSFWRLKVENQGADRFSFFGGLSWLAGGCLLTNVFTWSLYIHVSMSKASLFIRTPVRLY